VRILAIRGENIASLDRFEIDFRVEPLASAGIYAITGPTGSGKSSILDAMCLALYQDVPRMDGNYQREAKIASVFGEIGQVDIRNLIRRGTSTGFAETDFVGIDGEAYRAHWGWHAAKRKGAASQERITLTRLPGGEILADAKQVAQEKIRSLLGLTFDQFIRTVLLAQGRFAEFLRADVESRADLLEKLTGTDIYSRISLAVHERKVTEESKRHELEIRLREIASLSPEQREAKLDRSRELAEVLPALASGFDATRDLLAAVRSWKIARRESVALADQTGSVRSAVESAKKSRDGAKESLEAFAIHRKETESEIQRAVALDARLEAQLISEQDCTQRESASTRKLLALESDENDLRKLIIGAEGTLAEIVAFLESKSRLAPVAQNWGHCRSLLNLCTKAREEQRTQEHSRGILQERIHEWEPQELELSANILLEERLLDGIDRDALPRRRKESLERLEDLSQALRQAELDAEESSLETRSRWNADGFERARAKEFLALEKWNQTRNLADSLRISVSESVQRMRETLVEGQECPVCGSRHHPHGADSTSALLDLLARHERELSAAEDQLGLVRKEVAGFEATLEQCRLEQERIGRGRKESGSVTNELRSEIQDLGDQASLDWLHQQVVSIEEAISGIELARETMARVSGQKHKLSEISRSFDADRTALERSCEATEKAERDFQEHARTLDGIFGPDSPWRVNWESNQREFVERLERQIPEYLGKATAKDACEAELKQDRLRMEGIKPQLEDARSESREAARRLRDVVGTVLTLREERLQLLGGRSVTETQEEIAGQETFLTRELELRQEELDSRLLENERHETLRERRSRDAAVLEERILREAPSRTETWPTFPPGSEPDPDSIEAMLLEALEGAERALSGARDERASLEAELKLDRDAVETSELVQQRIERQSSIVARWAALSASIGSASGKLFKVVAQRYTLEVLLEEANRELSLIAPRYSLRIIEDTMHFGVVDRDAFGEIRPVHTLSGGESFMVSLALALGLSHLAGGNLRIESLFIDEGFGSLDPSTLRTVMGALSNLHAQGRKVGVITHVEEMKEQIDVRIEVVRVGPGLSQVRVVG